MAAVTHGEIRTSIVPNAGLLFKWDCVSQSTTNNTSEIAWSLHIITNSAFGSSVKIESVSNIVTINDIKTSGPRKTFTMKNNMNMLVLSGTTTVPHNSDGSLTIDCVFTQAFYAEIRGEYVSAVSGEGTFVLPTIPRYAYIRSVYDFDDETSALVRFHNPAGSDVESLSIGAYFVNDPSIKYERIITNKHAGTYNFNFDANSELPEIYEKMTNSVSEKVIFYIKSTLGGKEQIATVPHVAFKIVPALPEIDPVIQDTNTRTAGLTEDPNVIVAGHSIIKAKLNVVCKKGATIAYQNVYCHGVPITPITDPDWDWQKDSPDYGDFKIVVEDSRGNRIERDIIKNVVPYISPTINIDSEKIIYDTMPNVAYYKIKLSGNAFRSSFDPLDPELGQLLNTVMVYYRYKTGNTDWSRWTSSVMPYEQGKTYAFEAIISDTYDVPIQFHIDDNVSFQAIVSDDLHRENHDRRPPYDPKEGAIWTEKIGRIPLFDYGKSDFKFNVPVDLPGLSINGVSLEDYIRQIVESM